ncbi:hypothetical protein K7432_004309 [Basidiobolus ranarum]|uniref:Uncharacterized protein n=1 Tax=Basidiobolus ranarum TaxID=34480 RepID=A0ABR2WYF1_9FUNG
MLVIFKEQFMHELSLMTLEQESKYESLRIQQLKELLRVEQTLSKAKNQWNHVVWEGKLDKLNQGSCIGELQFLSPTAVALENIPPVLLMNNRVELRELEEIIESNNILFFITRLLSRDKETISLFNREVRRVHDQHKAGRVTVAKHTHLYFIPLTKITLPSTPCSGLTSLLEDPRGKFLVVAPNHCSVAQKRVANEKWQLDLAKDWPHFRNNEQQS